MATWLGEHPSIYMAPIKEPFYFSSDIGNQWIRTWDAYIRLFNAARPQHVAVGEASPAYLFSNVAVPSIEAEVPSARFIVMMRNPVEMAYAFHEQNIRSGNETIRDFRQAWYLSPERREGWQVPHGCKDPVFLDYQSWCLLGEQLERLYGLVARQRVLVLVLDDMIENPRREYLRVLGFLGVSDNGRQKFPVYNPAREWRSPHLGRLVRYLGQGVGWVKYIAAILPPKSLGLMHIIEKAASRKQTRPPLPSDFLAELSQYFENDVRLVERLLDREFKGWRSNTDQMR